MQTMSIMKRVGVSVIAAALLSLSAQSGAIATTVDSRNGTAQESALRAPTPSCGSTVSVNRVNGNEIRVRGTGLGQFMPQNVNYGVSTTYEQNGQAHGAYNVSRFGGMDYTFTSSGTSTQQFRVVVSASDSSTSYCAIYLFA